VVGGENSTTIGSIKFTIGIKAFCGWFLAFMVIFN
jgi:hypothetical protein